MGYPKKFERMEKEQNKPIAEILLGLLNEYGSIAKVARILDMGYANVFHKVKECGLYQDSPQWRRREQPELEPENTFEAGYEAGRRSVYLEQ